MKLPIIIEQKLDDMAELCHQFGVRKMYLFGSAITDKFDEKKSDLDLIVEMEPMPPLTRGEMLIALWEALEDLFVRRIDLITDQPIKNHYLQANIDRTKVLIYDREGEKVFS